MTFNDVQFIFNRALTHTFSSRKILLTFCVLALSGLMVVFFRGLSMNAGQWVVMSLTFLPIFLLAGVLLATGIYLIRIYHDEIKQRKYTFGGVFYKSWEVIMGASYFSVPFILVYLLLWMMLGIFFLFAEIPYIGEFFSVILVLGPFLINLGSLLLCLLNVSMLFFVTPLIALKGLNRQQVAQGLVRRFKEDLFSNVVLAMVAALPLLVVFGLLMLAGFLTETVCFSCDKPIYNVIQWFFLMIPFAICCAPAVIFFFNFAAESHVLMMREVKAH